MIITYKIHELIEYINWIYFFHAWGLGGRYYEIADIHGCDSCRANWLAGFPEADRAKAAESMQLHKEAMRMLNELDKDTEAQTVYRLMEANSDGDNIRLEGTLIPLLRQQTHRKTEDPFLCLSDFIRPLSTGVKDTVGIFAATIHGDAAQRSKDDPYKQMLLQTIFDRLAEAATEKLHEYIRKEAWGYAKDEKLTMKEMLVEKYQGIRPAVGYPSLPDQSINFLLNDLLDMKQIGITLTDNGMMHPHASVSGFIIAHPSSRYFNVGKIGEDQLADYACRRDKSVEEIQKFLHTNL